MALTLLTFGFKHGPPRDADMVLDVRFLPNPHYLEDLRPLTGRDREVVEHVESGTRRASSTTRLLPMLDFLMPAYVAEGKTHLTIAIGCTGGRHRSVASPTASPATSAAATTSACASSTATSSSTSVRP